MIVGRSPAIVRALGIVERFATKGLPFLLVGQTGTGKELFAEHIHERSGRTGKLVDVNCGALPRDMIESLLFGHQRGAFTGATESVQGHVERSHCGTLFLDELASLTLEGQVKLLRVLESGAVQPLGAGSKRKVDLRLISTVHEGVLWDLEAGRFRKDLYQRVAGVVIELPGLAARPEDIVPLAAHFAALNRQHLESEAESVLLNHSWPGNVRELRLAIERAGQLVIDGTLPASAITEAIALGAPTGGTGGNLPIRKHDRRNQRGLDRACVMAACEAAAWRVEDAARTLSISRASLYRRLRRLGISTNGVSPSRPN